MDLPRDGTSIERVNENNFTNTPPGTIPMGNSIAESYCPPPIWDQTMNGHNLGYCDTSILNDSSTSSRANMSWIPNQIPGILPHFPADSAFIERAARFSCFSGGNLGEMMNPYGIIDPLNPYSRVLEPMHEMMEVKNDAKIDEFALDEAKNVSGNESDEAGFSGRGAREEESSGTRIGSKKRKRIGKDTEINESNQATHPSTEPAKNDAEIQQKGDPNLSPIGNSSGKNGKQGSQGSDPPKEDYIHVRARRGQATNSHSLAERVRREKISERMKFLQDLVPGCSKVTGKAVMLDEIINYVQSLQRQVEFLSMKLATVNPRPDFNIEGFLAKDILPPRAGLSSSLPFPPEMGLPFPPLHQLQPGLMQANFPALGSLSETLIRQINLQSNALSGGFKESTSQVPNVWDDELHNVIHTGFNSSTPLNTQDLSGSLQPGHLKTEP